MQVCPYLYGEIVMFMHELRGAYVYAWVETKICLCLGWDIEISLVILRHRYAHAEIET